ncbi:MAG: SIS domain-containing protein [Lachnospiraceae bacterium]|nr:SIS domain-containing protein [Lachnospiraceae bacterium]
MHTKYLKTISDLMENCKIYKQKELITDWDDAFEQIVELFVTVKKSGNQLFFIGNGGSSAIAGHMIADFMKNGGMRTISLYDNALTTCMGNDYGYEYVFSKPLSFLAKEGDLLVAISSSGNSQNVVNAINVAKEKGSLVVTFTGFKDDNVSKSLGDYNLYVPSMSYGMVESLHNLFLQQIVDTIMERDGMML